MSTSRYTLYNTISIKKTEIRTVSLTLKFKLSIVSCIVCTFIFHKVFEIRLRSKCLSFILTNFKVSFTQYPNIKFFSGIKSYY